ncbi:hypothetical protein N7474_010063 [Penicillium riverlandense]|uniref:uncharacterized protein n=1 Tax=Penicillium riverlandense TaxID=1903569 RepID=UPI00254812A3|nr:uncharacterized protein N7474_010063 [Penicillium riverlandense]KAJ5808794.1 hypothetical protein N7474_010063 [Penicillium riverlandense]
MPFSWVLSSWIHFRVPHDLDLRDATSPQADAIEPIRQASGHRRSAWGRVQSDPELTVLFSMWESRSAYDTFAASGAAQTFYEAIAALHPANTAASNIITYLANFPREQLSRPTFHPHTQLRPVFFPNLSEEAREAVFRHGGPAYPFAFAMHGGRSELWDEISAFHTDPRRGWIEGEMVRPCAQLPGESTVAGNSTEAEAPVTKVECRVLLIVMSWRSSEPKQNFLETTPILRGQESVPVMQEWEDTLGANGAVGWKDWYVDFEMVRKVDKVWSLTEL